MFGTVEKKVLEKLPDGVFVFDNKLRVKFMNAAFRRSFFIDGKSGALPKLLSCGEKAV